MSQRLLGKLSPFYTFYRLYILFYTPFIICFMLIYSSIQLYYNLYFLLQPIFSLFFVFLALPTEVKPLCKSQFMTEQRTDVDVDVENFKEKFLICLCITFAECLTHAFCPYTVIHVAKNTITSVLALIHLYLTPQNSK